MANNGTGRKDVDSPTTKLYDAPIWMRNSEEPKPSFKKGVSRNKSFNQGGWGPKMSFNSSFDGRRSSNGLASESGVPQQFTSNQNNSNRNNSPQQSLNNQFAAGMESNHNGEYSRVNNGYATESMPNYNGRDYGMARQRTGSPQTQFPHDPVNQRTFNQQSGSFVTPDNRQVNWSEQYSSNHQSNTTVQNHRYGNAAENPAVFEAQHQGPSLMSSRPYDMNMSQPNAASEYHTIPRHASEVGAYFDGEGRRLINGSERNMPAASNQRGFASHGSMYRSNSAMNERYNTSYTADGDTVMEKTMVMPGNNENEEVHISRRIIKRRKSREPRGGDYGQRVITQEDNSHDEMRRHMTTTRNNEDGRPFRTVSQTNVMPTSSKIKNVWTSDSNLGGKNTYSARRENQKLQNEHWQSSRNVNEGTEVMEQLETIMLKPIGRGVHSLQPSNSATLPRSMKVPSGAGAGGAAGAGGGGGASAYRTVSGHHSSMSNYNRQNSSYDVNTMRQSRVGSGMGMATEHHARTMSDGHEFADGGMGTFGGSRMDLTVRDTMNMWYLPDISRDQVMDMLRDREHGSFIIRKSTSFADSYGLALKVDRNLIRSSTEDMSSEPVRHFLIEPMPMTDGQMGVHLRGFDSEPTYASLKEFVHSHLRNAGSLPCCLRLPPTSSGIGGGGVSGGTMRSGFGGGYGTPQGYTRLRGDSASRTASPSTLRAVYVGAIDVDRLDGAAAAAKAVSDVIESRNPISLHEISVKITPEDGLSLSDPTHKTFFNKHIKASKILWAGLDPKSRDAGSTNISLDLPENAKFFVIVAKKQRLILSQNIAHVMCEVEPTMSGVQNFITLMNQTFMGPTD